MISQDTPNQYDLCSDDDLVLKPIPGPKTFTLQSSHPDLALPDPRYLALHCACAKMAHFSGAVEVVDDIIKELEETQVLASDGASADLLHSALSVLVY